jgi:hypothetical protein
LLMRRLAITEERASRQAEDRGETGLRQTPQYMTTLRIDLPSCIRSKA